MEKEAQDSSEGDQNQKLTSAVAARKEANKEPDSDSNSQEESDSDDEEGSSRGMMPPISPEKASEGDADDDDLDARLGRLRRAKRLAMNRETARKRRKRNKDMLETLQQQVDALTKENFDCRRTTSDLNARVEHLESELAIARTTVGQLRQELAHVHAAAAAAAPLPPQSLHAVPVAVRYAAAAGPPLLPTQGQPLFPHPAALGTAGLAAPAPTSLLYQMPGGAATSNEHPSLHAGRPRAYNVYPTYTTGGGISHGGVVLAADAANRALAMPAYGHTRPSYAQQEASSSPATSETAPPAYAVKPPPPHQADPRALPPEALTSTTSSLLYHPTVHDDDDDAHVGQEDHDNRKSGSPAQETREK